MSNNALGRKKSNFVEVSDVPVGAYVDVFYQGANRKLTFENFAKSIGPAGAIEFEDSDGEIYTISAIDVSGGVGSRGVIRQQGAESATPILNQQGSISYIRSVENGSGISASISPEEGLKLSHNFTQSALGEPIVKGIADASPEFVSFLAGAGISLTYDSDDATITINASANPTPSTVIVSSKSDFPTPVAGVITLAASKQYLLANSINLGTDKLQMGAGTEIRGAGPFATLLTYTGTDAIFTAEDSTFTLFNFGVNAPNGKLFETTNPTVQSSVVAENVFVLACDSIGSISDSNLVIFRNLGVQEITTTGLTFSGTCNYVTMNTNYMVINAGTLFDFDTATFKGVSVIGNFFPIMGAGVTLIDGATGSANIEAGGYASVVDNRITENDVTLTNVSESDIRWHFLGNDQLQDTERGGLVSMQGNATATVIASTSTPVKVAGAWTIETASLSGFAGTTGGRLTYNCEKPERFEIEADISVEPSSGSNQNTSLYIAKNGTVITGSRIERPISVKATISTSWRLTLEEGDYIEVFVQNATATNNLVVSRAVLRVS